MSRVGQRRPTVPARVLPHDSQAVVEYERATLDGGWLWMSICGGVFVVVFLLPLLLAYPTWYMAAVTIVAVCLLVLYVIVGFRNRGARDG